MRSLISRNSSVENGVGGLDAEPSGEKDGSCILAGERGRQRFGPDQSCTGEVVLALSDCIAEPGGLAVESNVLTGGSYCELWDGSGVVGGRD